MEKMIEALERHTIVSYTKDEKNCGPRIMLNVV